MWDHDHRCISNNCQQKFGRLILFTMGKTYSPFCRYWVRSKFCNGDPLNFIFMCKRTKTTENYEHNTIMASWISLTSTERFQNLLWSIAVLPLLANRDKWRVKCTWWIKLFGRNAGAPANKYIWIRDGNGWVLPHRPTNRLAPHANKRPEWKAITPFTHCSARRSNHKKLEWCV